MIRNKKLTLLFFSFLVFLQVGAEVTNFTPNERQQINVPTPGLFSKTKSFSVDFSRLNSNDYSYPLPVGKSRKRGNSVEITTTKGDAVKSMFSGVVRLVKNIGTYGSTIVVRHSNGLETVYSNLQGATVEVGTRVKAGQTIGIVGESGKNGVCNFQIMVNGCPINAETLLSITSHKLHSKTYLFTNEGASVHISQMAADESLAASKKKRQEPVIDISEDFTPNELRVVATPTKGLFDNTSSITIDLSKYNTAEWCYPLPGAHVISPYGGGRRHSGVDLKTRANDDICAVFDGCVRFSGKYFGYGNVIVIRHPNGMETLYSHNSKNLVKTGDHVKAGQVIALTGRTGRATTEHCHFEVRINGKTYDPAKFFDHGNQSLRKVKVIAQKSGKVTTVG